jgi:putative flippase GtrA
VLASGGRAVDVRDGTTAMKLPAHQIGLRFVGFAGVATLVNLAAQEACVRAVPAAPLMISILAGTAAGFFVKYVLDKWYVFYDAYGSATDEARKITIYAVCSVLTTLIFWAFEMGCWKIWGTSFAKYSGAVAGLAIGYAIKYYLDLRYVFRQNGP